MRHLIAIAALLPLGACVTTQNAVKNSVVRPSVAAGVSLPEPEACRTVKIFEDTTPKSPAPGTPKKYSDYLGSWSNGKWGGKWCHGIEVTKVTPTGEATVYSKHAPYKPWGVWATSFKRKAKITKDGYLVMKVGNSVHTYWLENGELYGIRRQANGAIFGIKLEHDAIKLAQQ